MSTEGSVSTSGNSSGIRQFGLYRTIDARTEEFLRLSRKRQLRRGCACAAISTAITVTVVIIMILIYEYSIIYESSSKTSVKQNWMSLMNKSAQDFPFEAKLNRAKLNLDPVYVQYLPLILKTLKKNKYLDNIIEGTTQVPLNDKRDKPEDLYIKNIFSDSRNWMRIPTSRTYSIEYKTSPILYFKYPTRNVEDFTRIRRIRDYQRIMNYVDKMISEKTSTISMFKNTYRLNNKKSVPVTHMSTTPMIGVIENVTKKQTGPKKLKLPTKSSITIEQQSACHCPKSMGLILSKLIESIHKIIPDFISHEQISGCNDNKSKTNRTVSKNEHESSNKQFKETNNNNYYQSNEIPNMNTIDFGNDDLKIKPNMIPNTISETYYSVKPLCPKVDYTMSSIIKLIKPHLFYSKSQQNNRNISNTTTIKQFIEETDANHYFSESTTKSLSKTTSKSTKTSSNTLKTVKDWILQKTDFNATKKSLLTFPALSDTEYGEYYTTPDIVDNFKIFDVDRARDEKRNSKGETNLEILRTRPSLKPTYYNKQEHNGTWNILRKMGKDFSLAKIQNSSHQYNEKLSDTMSTKIVTEKENTDFKTRSILSQSSTQPYSYLSENKLEGQIKNEDVTLEEEIDKAEEINENNSLKSLEILLNKINVSEIFNRTLKKETEKEISKFDQYESMQIGKHTDMSCSKSMIPGNRPSYLEIHRNVWERIDEHQDYDNTVNNNYVLY